MLDNMILRQYVNNLSKQPLIQVKIDNIMTHPASKSAETVMTTQDVPYRTLHKKALQQLTCHRAPEEIIFLYLTKGAFSK